MSKQMLEAVTPSVDEGLECLNNVIGDGAEGIWLVGRKWVPKRNPIGVPWIDVDRSLNVVRGNQLHDPLDERTVRINHDDAVTDLNVLQDHGLHERRLPFPGPTNQLDVRQSMLRRNRDGHFLAGHIGNTDLGAVLQGIGGGQWVKQLEGGAGFFRNCGWRKMGHTG